MIFYEFLLNKLWCEPWTFFSRYFISTVVIYCLTEYFCFYTIFSLMFKFKTLLSWTIFMTNKNSLQSVVWLSIFDWVYWNKDYHTQCHTRPFVASALILSVSGTILEVRVYTLKPINRLLSPKATCSQLRWWHLLGERRWLIYPVSVLYCWCPWTLFFL